MLFGYLWYSVGIGWWVVGLGVLGFGIFVGYFFGGGDGVWLVGVDCSVCVVIGL